MLHDCSTSNCNQTHPVAIRREREETSRTKQAVTHAETGRFTLNTFSLHSRNLISELVPSHLQKRDTVVQDHHQTRLLAAASIRQQRKEALMPPPNKGSSKHRKNKPKTFEEENSSENESDATDATDATEATNASNEAGARGRKRRRFYQSGTCSQRRAFETRSNLFPVLQDVLQYSQSQLESRVTSQTSRQLSSSGSSTFYQRASLPSVGASGPPGEPASSHSLLPLPTQAPPSLYGVPYYTGHSTGQAASSDLDGYASAFASFYGT